MERPSYDFPSTTDDFPSTTDDFPSTTDKSICSPQPKPQNMQQDAEQRNPISEEPFEGCEGTVESMYTADQRNPISEEPFEGCEGTVESMYTDDQINPISEEPFEGYEGTVDSMYTADQKDDEIHEIETVVAALYFGNTYSGYAFSTKSDFEKNPLTISINKRGQCASRSDFGDRISTCILFDGQKEFVSFGYAAENDWVNYAKPYRESCLFTRHLLETLNVDKIIDKEENVIKKHFRIWKYLEALIDECKKKMENLGDVKRWVITVPTDMTDTAEGILKLCIKRAGIPLHQFTLVTEAEASFAYCEKLLDSESNFEDSSEYMIVDFGDDNADIRVVKKVCGELRVKYRQTRSKGTSIYKQFYENLKRILKKRAMTIIENDPLGSIEFERGLEEVKLSGRNTNPISMHLHQSTLDKLKELKLDVRIPEIEIRGRKLILQSSTYAKIFNNLIKDVTSRMEKVFEVYKEANKITHIVMTGDFYQCRLVKEGVEIKFHEKRIMSSAFEEKTVVKGAVLYGWQPFKYTFELLRTYDKPADQNGFVMIINFLFKGSNHERKGSEEDVKQLQVYFGKHNYEVWTYSDMNSDDLKEELEKVKTEILTRNSDEYHSFICVIMSHGNQRGISTSDGIITVSEIVSMFKNDQVRSFIGKPKIFLVQACRGHEEQDLNRFEQNEKDYMERLKTPTDADIMTMYATTPGYVSLRRTISSKWIGAWFIHAFITAAERYPNNHILEILTAVNYELANNPEYVFQDGKKGQMSIAEVTLTKLFYF